MSNDLKVTLENINQRLLNIDKVAREQEEEIQELKKKDEEKSRALNQVYEELKRKKLTINEYQEKCGTLPSTKGSGSRHNE